MSKQKHKTREEWLMAAMVQLWDIFRQEAPDHKLPKKVRVSCGFPSKNPLGNKLRRIGECWSDKASKGSYFEIFVSPLLKDPVAVLDTLIHEMVHTVVGIEAGHKAPFKKVAVAVGLEGPMRATHAGAGLKKRLYALSKALGDYPHDELSKMTNGRKKDSCRLLKVECPECGYTVRTTRKWLEVGVPTCPCGAEMIEPEEDE